jgi:Porin subfamily
MKMVKSLILGSAAGLIAMSGAQAADLPVKAKAVEYVRICSLYGAGFYYIPGTDTCIKLGGYLRVEAALNTNSVYDTQNAGVAGARNRLSNYYTARSREDLNIDTRTATEYGVVRTYFDVTFSWTSGSYSGNPAVPGATVYQALGGGGTVSPASAPQNANPGSVAGGSVGVYYAFIQFAGFTMGKAISQFSAPWTNYPANNFDGLPGGGGAVTGVNQFAYTAQFGNGVSGTISLEDSTVYKTTAIGNLSVGLSAANLVSGSFGASDFGGTRSPDIIGMLRVDQAWGLFQLSAAGHQNHAAYYAVSPFGPAGTELAGHPDDKWGWAVQAALSIKNIPTGAGDTLNIQGVYTNGASRYNFQDLMATNYVMYGGTGVPGAYQSIGFGAVTDSVFVSPNAFGGGQQELTTTYGFRGGYTHNWDPYWNTGLYGAWAAVKYNDRAKALICVGVPGGHLGLGNFTSTGFLGCNPDFNLAVVGFITRWTPVKNLTFSADLTYTMLDQKFASGTTFLAPAALGVAKPAAVYEVKDQNSLTLLLRAQRNW